MRLGPVVVVAGIVPGCVCHEIHLDEVEVLVAVEEVA